MAPTKFHRQHRVCAVLAAALAAVSATCSCIPAGRGYTNSLGMRMVRIDPGSFQMGNPDPALDQWDESPVHAVTISRAFFVSEAEVSVDQYRRFKPGFLGSAVERPAATGLSWEDAEAFCRWLSEREGKPYRLPTEAEWEYAARAGSSSPFWSGTAPPAKGAANPWGLTGIHEGAAEWCSDWYGPYPSEDRRDPVGPASGLSRVVRGGGLDVRSPYYATVWNRASYAPAFAIMAGTEAGGSGGDAPASTNPEIEGLTGVWYGRTNFEDPKAVDTIMTLEMDWKTHQQPGEERGEMWSARWGGFLLAPVSGEVTFHVRADGGAALRIDGNAIVEWSGAAGTYSGRAKLEKGKLHPVEVSYIHNKGEESVLSIRWSWEGKPPDAIGRTNLRHSQARERAMRALVPPAVPPGHHPIGFRIVQAPFPPTPAEPEAMPFVRQCVRANQPELRQGPDPKRPWFRRRSLLPIPPYAAPQEDAQAAGLDPGMMPHIHAPGLVVMPNGDLLATLFTSRLGPKGEDRPDVSLIATRLRFGAIEWDLPEVFLDFADVNDTSTFLHREGNTILHFWGHAFLPSGYPFQWTVSNDNGATWDPVRFPAFVGEIGPHTNQPVNTAVRGSDGTFYLPADGRGGSSVLWVSADNMNTWRDPCGRTLGRHSNAVLLKDGRLLVMGGKTASIDGYMPKNVTADGGRTYTVTRSPFPALASGQRPTLIRLQSGRLFFAGDLQDSLGRHPPEILLRGAYVALSEDDGEIWRIKKLPGTLPADPVASNGNPNQTIGYAIARQADNGLIHMVTTKTVPPQYWQLNEAWILSKDAGFLRDSQSTVSGVRGYRETYRSGKMRVVGSGGVTTEGEYRLHGRQTWFFENGKRQWEVSYEAGRKVGVENLFDPDGRIVWTWRHRPDGSSLRTVYWPNGVKRSEAEWRDLRATGIARRWDPSGRLISERRFVDGFAARP